MQYNVINHCRCGQVNVYRFWWDEQNIEHIANHGVEPYEAELLLPMPN